MIEEEEAQLFITKDSPISKHDGGNSFRIISNSGTKSNNHREYMNKLERFQDWFLSKIKSPCFIIVLYVFVPCLLICLLFTSSSTTYVISPSKCDLSRIPKSVVKLIIKDKSCNNKDLMYVDFYNFQDLKTIEIGNSCFVMTTFFRVFELGNLESLKIGDNCFDTSGDKKKLRITKNPKLQSLVIGKNSFTYFSQFHLMGRYYVIT